jgi:hypothetical protein
MKHFSYVLNPTDLMVLYVQLLNLSAGEVVRKEVLVRVERLVVNRTHATLTSIRDYHTADYN